jgi:hypothetical protein
MKPDSGLHDHHESKAQEIDRRKSDGLQVSTLDELCQPVSFPLLNQGHQHVAFLLSCDIQGIIEKSEIPRADFTSYVTPTPEPRVFTSHVPVPPNSGGDSKKYACFS